jgi:hypothetical protein
MAKKKLMKALLIGAFETLKKSIGITKVLVIDLLFGRFWMPKKSTKMMLPAKKMLF